jgi:hypothetical protein
MNRLLVIIPTRNRATLAANAIASVLECDSEGLEVLLSDNSTDDAQTDQLAELVSRFGDSRVALCRPPESMTMTHHWNWVLEAACDRGTCTHVVVLTDRMMFKRHALSALVSVMAAYPHLITSYNHDRVVDHRTPYRAELQPWSDEVLQISSERLLRLSANCTLPQALPRLLNCAVPVAVLEDLKQRCGNIVSSISPDHSFCYRALAIVDKIAYWDRAPIIHYALGRSNGESAARGVHTRDHVDFLSTIAGVPFASAPMPGILTVGNSVLHEYAVAREEMGSDKFPPVNEHAYISWITSEIEVMENAELVADMMERLAEYERALPPSFELVSTPPATPWLLRRVARRLGLGRAILNIRQFVSRLSAPPSPAELTFASAADAIEFAQTHDGERGGWNKRLEYLVR